ncbi:hypothetical protein N7454_003961 [Penicillium verhagenii]|nr:hypothetical protein N7454_003961 [Penicillium verhagenii]
MQAPTPILYPTPVIGNDTQPGFWSNFSINGAWFVHKSSPIGHRVGSKICMLRNLPPRREPGLRIEGGPLTGDQFFTKVNRRRENVESLVAQSVGMEVLPGQECDSCKRKLGPFTSCVVVPSLGNKFLSCANCHWQSRGKRCSFMPKPPPSSVLTQAALAWAALAQAALADLALVDPAIADPAIVDSALTDPAIVDPAIVDSALIDLALVDPALIHSAPIDPAPIDPAPIDPAIVSDLFHVSHPNSSHSDLFSSSLQPTLDLQPQQLTEVE